VIAGAGGTYELFAGEQCLAYRVVGGSQLLPLRLAEELGVKGRAREHTFTWSATAKATLESYARAARGA